jgi:hypothetical protein
MKKLFLIAAAVTLLASPAVASDDLVAPNVVCRQNAPGGTCYDRNRNVAPLPSGEYFANRESAEAVRLMAAEVYSDCRNFTGHIPPTQNWSLVERFEACRKAARR